MKRPDLRRMEIMVEPIRSSTREGTSSARAARTHPALGNEPFVPIVASSTPHARAREERPRELVRFCGRMAIPVPVESTTFKRLP